MKNILKNIRYFAAFLTCVLSIAHADTFAPTTLQSGDTWTYALSIASDGKVNQFEQEYTIIGKNQAGRFILGERRPKPGYVWSVGKFFSSDRCFVFLLDLTETFGDDYCNRDVQPGQQVDYATSFVSRKMTYVGMTTVATKVNNFTAAHFIANEVLLETDSSAPDAKKRTWDFWYSEQARAFVKVELRYFNEAGSVVRQFNFELIGLQLKEAVREKQK